MLLINRIFYPPSGSTKDRFFSYTDGISLLGIPSSSYTPAHEGFLALFPTHFIHQSQNPEALVCVSVDLSDRDRSGIVWGMSRLIEGVEQIIYLSTVRSANILVLEADLGKFDLLGIEGSRFDEMIEEIEWVESTRSLTLQFFSFTIPYYINLKELAFFFQTRSKIWKFHSSFHPTLFLSTSEELSLKKIPKK